MYAHTGDTVTESGVHGRGNFLWFVISILVIIPAMAIALKL